MFHYRVPLRHKNGIKKPKDAFDKIIYFFAFAAPLFELPQLITIYSNQSAKNVSPITWGFFALASFMWLIYAIRHRLAPVIVSYALFWVFESATFIGIIIYR
ncbi:MAG: PQ-loop domain-containing transporter [Candidatus Saccharimonadales bacterium]